MKLVIASCFVAVALGMMVWIRTGKSLSRSTARRPTVRRDLFVLESLLGFLWPNCAPPGFDAIRNFDLDSYVSKVWHPIKAAPVIYATGQSYCSIVQYTIDTSPCNLLCDIDKPSIQVRNRGRQNGVDGPVNGSGFLSAFVPNVNEPSKLKVSGLQRFVWWTNYWVVAAGTYTDALDTAPLQPEPPVTDYDWVIIAGASPFRQTQNGKCMPGFGWFDTRGLWMFCRDPLPPDGVVDAIENLADSMGLDTTQWIPVVHEGCEYPSFDE